jgi:NADH-quinone oxidoreductase subunit D
LINYADRLDPENAAFGELALCLAVEKLGGITVPERAQGIRVILSEMTRVSNHFGFLARMADSVGADTMKHYVLRDREKVLDLFELLTGARFSVHFLRYGGVCADVTEGFIERALDFCDLIRKRLKEYNDLFSFNHAFLRRSAGIGVLSPETVARLGITGPNARASGVDFDVRKAHIYSGYNSYDFEVPLGHGEKGVLGDVHDRYLIRLREITQSIEILKQACESLPRGPYLSTKVKQDFKVVPGEAYARIESSRGLLGCFISSDGSEKPNRVQFRVPSVPVLDWIPELVQGARLEDLPVLLASLDFGVAEVDR